MKACPICGSRKIGLINRKRYYCADCYQEWSDEDGVFSIYKILIDGSYEEFKFKIS